MPSTYIPSTFTTMPSQAGFTNLRKREIVQDIVHGLVDNTLNRNCLRAEILRAIYIYAGGVTDDKRSLLESLATTQPMGSPETLPSPSKVPVA